MGKSDNCTENRAKPLVFEIWSKDLILQIEICMFHIISNSTPLLPFHRFRRQVGIRVFLIPLLAHCGDAEWVWDIRWAARAPATELQDVSWRKAEELPVCRQAGATDAKPWCTGQRCNPASWVSV